MNTFDQQVEILIRKGYPKAAGMKEDQFLGYVDLLSREFEIGDILVVPERIISVSKKMSMVKLNGKTGYTYLNLDNLPQGDGVKTSNMPYLMRGVENGSAIQNISFNECVTQFNRQGRLGCTVDEGIAIVTYDPETLMDHYINLLGSYDGAGWIPNLWLYKGRPILDNFLTILIGSNFGYASCGKRIRSLRA